jgi:hypothetical protein
MCGKDSIHIVQNSKNIHIVASAVALFLAQCDFPPKGQLDRIAGDGKVIVHLDV